MKSIILVCAICLSLGKSYGSDDTDGVGAFAYNGPSGRYGATYGLRNGQVVNQQGNLPPNFVPPNPFSDIDDFFPDYFGNLGNTLQDASPFIRPPPFIRLSPFPRLFSNPYVKRFPYGGNFPGFDGFSGAPEYLGGHGFQGGHGFRGGQGFQGQGFPDMSNYGRSPNSAYASAAIGRNYKHQVADINPANPSNPNINKYSNIDSPPNSGFKSVSSSSFASSSNHNGRKVESRGAETIVNDNGVITKYKVMS